MLFKFYSLSKLLARNDFMPSASGWQILVHKNDHTENKPKQATFRLQQIIWNQQHYIDTKKFETSESGNYPMSKGTLSIAIITLFPIFNFGVINQRKL